MARKEDKNTAIKLRKQGFSYSMIKDKLGISKGTLSNWLSDFPLSETRINQLKHNDAVIEKIRQKKQQKRELRQSVVLKKVSEDINQITDRQFFIAGFFLYWAEGGKTTKYNITLSNTDPAMIRAFIKWLDVAGLARDRMYIKLHLYADMNEEDEIKYWSGQLKVSKKFFKKSYIKQSRLSDLTYVNKGHGTCNVVVPGRDVTEYVLEGLKKIKSFY